MRKVGRRRKYRKIGKYHNELCFKACGKDIEELEEIILYDDELEALRLCDYQEMYQQEAANNMEISRTTFSRIVTKARKKVIDALLHQKVLKIEKRIKENNMREFSGGFRNQGRGKQGFGRRMNQENNNFGMLNGQGKGQGLGRNQNQNDCLGNGQGHGLGQGRGKGYNRIENSNKKNN